MGLADLDGIEFVAKIEIIKDKQAGKKNEIRIAVTNNDQDYAALISKVHSTNIATNSNRSNWA